VRLTDRVIPDRSLPAKAIDLLDRAGARVRREGKTEVDREDIVAVLSALVDLPREFLALSPSERFRGMEAALRDRVFGHDDALAAVVRALAQNWARFGSRRPLGSFLLAGPPGAGKRTAAVAIAEWLFGSSQAVLEVDLADYAETHSLSHLIGSPPGYVGHEEGGLLADTLIRRPFLLVLWQHLEQANPAVLSLIGQILSEGTATDRKGRRMDFRNTVHVLTVTEGDGAGRPVGFGAARAPDEARARLKKTVPAEVLGAVDQVLAFGPLDASALRRVAGRVVTAAATAFRDEHGVNLAVDDEVVDALAAHAAGRGGGGGAVESLVADRILRPATDAVFGDPASRGAGLRASLAGQGRDGVEVAVRTAE
jgi:ATP-dependent Clp protease ATP-binding subunit ClpC